MVPQKWGDIESQLMGLTGSWHLPKLFKSQARGFSSSSRVLWVPLGLEVVISVVSWGLWNSIAPLMKSVSTWWEINLLRACHVPGTMVGTLHGDFISIQAGLNLLSGHLQARSAGKCVAQK